MTNHYLPTRADQLKPGDVVRDPYSDGLEAAITYAADDGGMVRLVFDGNEREAVLFEPGEMLDRRITDEEHGALSAPGVRDE